MGFVAHVRGERSNAIIAQGLQILANLDHRGGVGADPSLGDGAGCLIQIPDALFRAWAERQRLSLPPRRRLCRRDVLPAARRSEPRRRGRAVRALHPDRGPGAGRLARGAGRHGRARRRGARVDAGDPPGGGRARRPMRATRMRSSASCSRSASRPRTRSKAEAQKRDLPGLSEFYIASFSSRTLVYKGMLLAHHVGRFLPATSPIR